MLTSLRRSAAVLLLVLPLLAQAGAGQVSSARQPPTFHQTVRRVVEDVVVTDALGHPIAGLHRRDFHVSEDGVPQRILSFEAHTLQTRHEELASSHLPPDTLVDLPSRPTRGPLYVLVYDMLHMSRDNQMYARQQLIQFIRSKPEGTRFAVFAISDGIHLVQGFTDNRKPLLNALAPDGSTPHMPKAFLYAGNYIADNPQAKAMLEIANYVAGLPGRKNVLWMADSFDLPLFPSMGPPQEERAAARLLRTLATRDISLYPVDVSGVASHGLVEMTRYHLEDTLARETGGRAYYSTNDLVDALNKATEAGAIYYTLTYDPVNQNYGGQFRHIRIRLTKSRDQLWYRPGYYASPEATPQPSSMPRQADSPPPDTLYVRVRHGMPMSHGVVFLAKLLPAGTEQMATPAQMATLERNPAYFKTRRRRHSAAHLPPVRLFPCRIDYAIPARQFREQPGMKHVAQDTLEFAAAAYNRNGLLLNGIIDHAVSARKGAARYYRAEQDFNVPQGAVWISLAVHDVDTGQIGNLEVALSGPCALPGSSIRPGSPAK